MRHASLMEPFDIGLDGEEIEASPDFDNFPAEPPKKNIRNNEKERDCVVLDKKNHGLSLDELASFCLDKTRTKLIQHPNAAVKEFFVL